MAENTTVKTLLPNAQGAIGFRAAIIIAACSLAALAVIIVFFSKISIRDRAQESEAALQVAEMGMQTVLDSITVTWPKVSNIAPTPYRQGSFRAEVSLQLPDSILQVKAHGLVHNSERIIIGTFKPLPHPERKFDWQRLRWEIF